MWHSVSIFIAVSVFIEAMNMLPNPQVLCSLAGYKRTEQNSMCMWCWAQHPPPPPPPTTRLAHKTSIKELAKQLLTVKKKLEALFVTVASTVDWQPCRARTNSVHIIALQTSTSKKKTTRSVTTTCVHVCGRDMC